MHGDEPRRARRGRHLRRRRPRDPAGRRTRSCRCSGSWTIGSFSEQPRRARSVSRASPNERCRAATACGRTSRRRWISRCARRTRHCTRCSDASREPVRFVVSLRLGEPPSMEPLRKRLSRYPELRFKLDPTSSWSERLIAELVATGAVESVDFKALLLGLDRRPGARPGALPARASRRCRDAWIEDPALTAETDAVLAAHRERFSWDAPIHSVADIEALPYPPRMVNIKPSRLGGLRNLLDAFDYCAAARHRQLRRRAVRAGRGTRADPVPRLAVPRRRAQRRGARAATTCPSLRRGCRSSPLAPMPLRAGFRWSSDQETRRSAAGPDSACRRHRFQVTDRRVSPSLCPNSTSSAIRSDYFSLAHDRCGATPFPACR